MKNFIIASILCAFSSAAISNTISKESLCEAQHFAAFAVMESRQIGMPVTQVMGLLSKVLSAHNGVGAGVEEELFYRQIVLNAYSIPMAHSDDYKTRAILEFSNKYYLDCWARNTIY